MKTIDRLRSIVLGAPNAKDAVRFYTDVWGLEVVAADHPVFYLRGSGAEHYVLGLSDGPQRRVIRLEFGTPSRSAVDALYDNCKKLGVQTLGSPESLDTPGGGYGFDFVDMDGRRIRAASDVEEHAERADPHRPRRLSHVVLNTPDLKRAEEFYHTVLGLRVSDYSEMTIVFMRCSREHHSVAFFHNQYPSINHIAYDMSDIDAVMRGIGRMNAAGWPLQWGPGRHGPGNNVFAYFIDPGGFVIEYTCDLEKVDEASHKPRVWRRVPEDMDRWGTSGPATPEIRAAMTGVPDCGVEL